MNLIKNNYLKWTPESTSKLFLRFILQIPDDSDLIYIVHFLCYSEQINSLMDLRNEFFDIIYFVSANNQIEF